MVTSPHPASGARGLFKDLAAGFGQQHHSDQHQKDSKSSHKSDHKSDPKSDPKTDLKSGLKSTVRLAGASTHKAVTFAELPQPSYHSLSQTCLMPVYDSYAFGVHQYLRSGARLYEHGPSWC